MTDRRTQPDDRPNIGSEPIEAEIQALQGEEMPADQDGALSIDEIDPDELGGVDVRDGETTDPIEAAEEGLAWIAPSDPPTVPSEDPGGIEIAAGTGPSADNEPYDDDHGSGELDAESDMTARVRAALRADSETSGLADSVQIAVIGSTAIIRGVVDDLDDGDALVEVAGRVDGIEDVRDETTVAGLDG
jgi:BON domain